MKVRVKYIDGTVLEYNKITSIVKKIVYVCLYYENGYFERIRKFKIKSVEIVEI